MSTDYYFHKWQRLLDQLESVVNTDLSYQEHKLHEPKECGIVQRLSGILGAYTAIYNDCQDCLQQNLQQQKTAYITNVLHAVAKRIVELKHQLSKVEHSNYQFVTRGLANNKLTSYEVEFTDIPERALRPPGIQAAIDDVWRQAKELEEKLEEERRLKEEAEKEQEPNLKLWMDPEPEEEEPAEKIDEETKERRRIVNLIGANEKCRRVIVTNIHKKLRREMWEKMLLGEAMPEAKKEIKISAAKFIQKVFRAYFKIKREKILNCKRDQILGLYHCKKPSEEPFIKCEKERTRRMKLQKNLEEEWKKSYVQLREKCFARRCDEIKEDYRDDIRAWFYKWYKEAWFFYDIPKANQGGSVLILQDVVPSPGEWTEQNKQYADRQKANKGKSPEQLKLEKKALKQEAQRAKKEEAMKLKMQEKMLAKMMKNPKMHPGYTFPESKETQNIVEAITRYKADWDDLDAEETRDVKAKFVKKVDESNAWADIKLELRPQVDDHMREEQKKLKNALKIEYDAYEEQWPSVIMPQKFPKIPKPKKIKDMIKDDVIEKMVNLIMKRIMKQYPKTKITDFKGEPNFAGDDLKCNFKQAIAYAGETRQLWWEKCRELSHGLNKLLLVGPKGSGRTILVYTMATLNDAVLFELELSLQYFDEDTTNVFKLQELVNSIAACAKAAQPAIIYIKYVNRIFYTKVPPEEPVLSAELLKKFLIKKLAKKFNKNDKVTIIGTCQDPWLLKSGQLLKQFPNVVLMPNTTYTTTFMMLKEWIINNRMVPPDLDVSCLAHVLQGYRYGYLQDSLKKFLSAERIARIAAYGLTPQDIYYFILQDDKENPVEYDKYIAWYTTKTHWGIQERKHLEQQIEFEAMIRKYEEKTKKNKRASAPSSAASSLAGDF